MSARTRRIENIKVRFERGDGLYGADAIRVLLEEIAALSERLLDFQGISNQDRVMQLLVHEQHVRCAYGTREGDGRSCDCKFGLGQLNSLSQGEHNGCPELRMAIRAMQGIWMRCWCGGKVGPREPGDANGLGCLEDIHHVWLRTLDNIYKES